MDHPQHFDSCTCSEAEKPQHHQGQAGTGPGRQEGAASSHAAAPSPVWLLQIPGSVCRLRGQETWLGSASSPCWWPGRPRRASLLAAVLLLFLPPRAAGRDRHSSLFPNGLAAAQSQRGGASVSRRRGLCRELGQAHPGLPGGGEAARAEPSRVAGEGFPHPGWLVRRRRDLGVYSPG